MLTTNGGPVAVATALGEDGRIRATLTTVSTWVREPEPALVSAALGAARLARRRARSRRFRRRSGSPARSTSSSPPASSTRLERLDYPFERAPGADARARPDHDPARLARVTDRFRARDPFPVGGVVEDPATGAAAAAFGAYLRARGEIAPPASFEIVQGVEMGRPSRLTVSIVPGEEG